MLDYLISKSNPRVQTTSLGLISMIASSDSGLEYLTQKQTDYVRKYYEHLVHVPELSVAHRFALAVMYKMSSHKDFAVHLLDCKVDNYIRSFIDGYSSKKAVHSYFTIFYTALAYNIITSIHTREKMGKFVTRYAPLMTELLEFFKKDLPSAAHLNILEICRFLLGPKEIYYRDLVVEARVQETLRVYYSSLRTLFAGREHILDIHLDQFSLAIKQTLAEKPKLSEKDELAQRRLEKQKEEEELQNKDKPRKMHDFEAFKDEILEDPLIA